MSSQNDNITLIVSLVIVFFVLRYLLSGGGGQNEDIVPQPGGARAAAGSLGARRRRQYAVSPAQVDAVLGMFPHFPRRVIEDDLALTGSVEATCDKILSGLLVPPPEPAPSANNNTNNNLHPSASHSSLRTINFEDQNAESVQVQHKVWEPSPSAREANLRARKEQMIRAARERLKKEKEKKEGGSVEPAPVSGPYS